MADVIYVCDSTGKAVFAYPSIGLIQTTDCRNGTGRWITAQDYVDERIDAYMAANPPTTPPVSATTPEQALVQVAMVASVSFVGLKGLAIGLMR